MACVLLSRHLTSRREVSMKQPRLFPDHEDTQAAPVFTAPQTVALIAVMSQIVQAFFELTTEGEDKDGSP
jgi:hypothetical protein